MIIVHIPIQNKWLNNLSYLSEQIYVGVIWKSNMNMSLWSFRPTETLFSRIFTGSKFEMWPNFKKSCNFPCIYMFVLPENKRFATKKCNH